MRRLRDAVAVICILAALAALNETLRKPNVLWDLQAYCGSLRAVQAGLDPYYIENVKPFSGNDLIMAYPAASLLIISPACVQPNTMFPALMALLLALIWVWLWKLWPEQPLVLAALLLAGFAATPYTLLTGNLGILELAAFVAAIVAMSNRRYLAAGAWMGLISAAKLTPLAFTAVLAAVVLRDAGRRSCLQFALGGAVGFAALHGLSFLMSPRYEYSMLQVLLGRIPEPGKFTPMREWHGDWTNPALPLVIKDVVRALEWPRAVALAIGGLLVAAAGLLFLRMWRRERDGWRLLAYGILMACLLLPRFKPYYFVYPLVPFYFLIRQQGYGQQTLLLVVGGLLPVLAYSNPLDRYVSHPALAIPLSASQVLFLLIVVALLLWNDRGRWFGISGAANPGSAPK